MRKANIHVMSLVAGTLIFLGAGCGQDQVAIPADRMNSDSALSFQPANPADARPAVAPAAADNAVAADAAGAPSGQWARPSSFPGILKDQDLRGKQATISTAKGDIVFEFLDQEAPKTVSNFIALARSG